LSFCHFGLFDFGLLAFCPFVILAFLILSFYPFGIIMLVLWCLGHISFGLWSFWPLVFLAFFIFCLLSFWRYDFGLMGFGLIGFGLSSCSRSITYTYILLVCTGGQYQPFICTMYASNHSNNDNAGQLEKCKIFQTS